MVAGFIELMAVRGDAEGAFKLALAVSAPSLSPIGDEPARLAAAFEEVLVGLVPAKAAAMNRAAKRGARGGEQLCNEVRLMFSVAEGGGSAADGRSVESRYGSVLRAAGSALDAAMKGGKAKGKAKGPPTRWGALDADGRKRVLTLAVGAFFEASAAVCASSRASCRGGRHRVFSGRPA